MCAGKLLKLCVRRIGNAHSGGGRLRAVGGQPQKVQNVSQHLSRHHVHQPAPHLEHQFGVNQE
eukprot:3550579-Rhodomonas_salina.2